MKCIICKTNDSIFISNDNINERYCNDCFRKCHDFSKAVVKCDNENNPPDVIKSKKIYIDVYIPKFGKDDIFILRNY
jgi:hypothetical protein